MDAIERGNGDLLRRLELRASVVVGLLRKEATALESAATSEAAIVAAEVAVRLRRHANLLADVAGEPREEAEHDG